MEKKLLPNGVKAIQRTEKFEYRIKPYLDWHRTLDRHLYMLDADSIEWRYKEKDVLTPVGVMEISRIDEHILVTPAYLQKVHIDRFNRDLQGKVLKRHAELLGTYGYIVLFRHSLTEFFVCNFSLDGPWKRYEPEEYRQFLISL